LRGNWDISLNVPVNLRVQAAARCQWLMPVILATPGAEIRKIADQSQPRQKFSRPYLGKEKKKKATHNKKGLVEWFKL
jgi:hypothetical protein